MKIRRLGYACINEVLNKGKPRISTSRTIRKSTYKEHGIDKIAEKALANLWDLLRILQWNEERGIKLFRMSSDIFPWKSEWEWEQLPVIEDAKLILKLAGDYAKEHGHRLSFHPGPFNKLCSSDERILGNTIDELEAHNDILNFMGFSPSYQNSINIHVGAAYGDKEGTLKTFCKNFERLSDSLQQRLTVENDDKDALYCTSELYEGVYKRTGIPIMFDFHHYDCYPDPDKNQREAANLAIKTWPDDITPLFHWSESKSVEQDDEDIRMAAHSDYCHGPLPPYNLIKEIDLMIEAKKKERSFPMLKHASGELVHNQHTDKF